MTRLILALPVAILALAACAGGPPPASGLETVIVDTVVVTREIVPALPQGRAATICLASGQSIEIRLGAAGDTLIGPQRVRMVDLGPGIGFVGDYAGNEGWFINDDAITFDRRRFSKFGQPQARECASMKIVGDFDGVNLFAETAASAPFAVLYVPVRPGVFQSYQSQVGRVRG
ncbi:MAG TPA: hypothetical protein VMM12_16880 [Longimicrobiales bacterium]|nr:hypothetical protein [Longimicrobiales bacterium]